MSPDKYTFTDPESGDEIESTRLAQIGAGVLVYGLVHGAPAALAVALLCSTREGALESLFAGAVVGIGYAVLGWRVFGLTSPFARRVHDAIARRQHRRQKPPADSDA
jgi:hypothetical protein